MLTPLWHRFRHSRFAGCAAAEVEVALVQAGDEGRAGRFVMLATVRGHHVSERNDEKVPIFQRRPFILWDESPSPPRSVGSPQSHGGITQVY